MLLVFSRGTSVQVVCICLVCAIFRGARLSNRPWRFEPFISATTPLTDYLLLLWVSTIMDVCLLIELVLPLSFPMLGAYLKTPFRLLYVFFTLRLQIAGCASCGCMCCFHITNTRCTWVINNLLCARQMAPSCTL